MDLLTLISCTLLASAIMSINMGLAFLSSPNERYLGNWLVAAIFFLLSNSIALYLNLAESLDDVTPTLANAFYYAGHAAILSGVYRYIYQKNPPFLISGVFLFTILVHTLPTVSDSVELRFLIFSPLIILLDFLAVLILFNQRKRLEGKAFWPLIATLFVFSALMFIRWVFIGLSESPLTIFGNESLQTAGSFVLITFIFLLTICCNHIVTWKKEVALEKATLTDHLTGWLNRRALSKLATNEFNRFKREKITFGILVLDIDHFKNINDKFGHEAGDRALQAFTSAAAVHVRDYDHCCRFGGEEFVILMPNTDILELKKIGERIGKAVEQIIIDLKDQSFGFTVSLGGSVSNQLDSNWEDSLRRADENLYFSKQHGRNQITISECH